MPLFSAALAPVLYQAMAAKTGLAYRKYPEDSIQEQIDPLL